jgi:tetratricopeptide (TPR) repeat protein
VKIFVSYSRRDAGDFAEQIRRHLSTFNHTVFTDIKSINVGDIWNDSIEYNITNCNIFVVIITHGSLLSPHVEKEVLQAQREHKIIIPCLHRDVEKDEIKWNLHTIQGIEFEDRYELTRGISKFLKGQQISRFVGDGQVSRTELSVKEINLKGNECYAKGDYSTALDYYDQAINISPNYAKAWNNKGLALHKLRKYQEAIEYFDRALEIDPEFARAWNNKGNVLHSLEKYQEAIKYYDRAVKIDPKYVKAWSDKGIALHNLGKYQEAIKYYDRAVKIDPKYASAWNNEGLALRKLGKQKE